MLSRLYHYTGLSTPFDPSHRLVTSPFSFLTAQILAGVRLFFAFYTLVTLLFALIWTSVRDKAGSGWFSYFTHLSYIGLCAYFFAAGIHTRSFASSISNSSLSSPSYYLQRRPRILQFLHLVLQATITTFPILVTLVYWILLADSQAFIDPASAYTNISMHILNLVFGLFEIFFTNVPPLPWLTLPCCIVILGGYLGVAYITQVDQGFYPYDFLDPQSQQSLLAAWICGLLGAYIIIFCLVRGAIVVRIYFVSRSRMDGHSSHYQPETIEDWETIERPSKEGAAMMARAV